MTGVILFVQPILFGLMAAMAWGSRDKPSIAAVDAFIAAGIVFFWVLLLRAYTDRVRGEGRVEQLDRDLALASGSIADGPKAPSSDSMSVHDPSTDDRIE